MFHRIIKKKIQFENSGHYIVTDQKLTDEELDQLGQLLDSFPHSSNSRDWPNKFSNLNIDTVPQKLVLLAANAYDSCGNTVLGVVAEHGKSITMLQRLIDLGADLNTPDDNMKKLPLHWAINNKLSSHDQSSYEAVAVVRCLLENGARTDITCYQHSTALEYAKARGFVAAADLIESAMNKKLCL